MQIENKGAIVDTDSGERVDFTLNPESFSDSKETEFAAIEIPGMSHPRLQFTGGAERTLSFSLFLHFGATDNVPKAIRTLQSWLYPEYINGKLKRGPSKLLIIFGETWSDEQWVLRNCEVTRSRFNKELECIFAEVSLEFVQYIEDSVDTKDVML